MFLDLFLPAAKPTGHRTVRVVVVVVGGLLWGHDLKGRPDQRSRSRFSLICLIISHPKFSSGWDPSGWSISCRSDFSLGWDLSFLECISLWGGISHLLNKWKSILMAPFVPVVLFYFPLMYCQCRRSLNKVCSCWKNKRDCWQIVFPGRAEQGQHHVGPAGELQVRRLLPGKREEHKNGLKQTMFVCFLRTHNRINVRINSIQINCATVAWRIFATWSVRRKNKLY